MNVSIATLESLCLAALRTVGVPETEAHTTTDVLVTTDTWGVFTHGTKNLRGYIRRLRGGGIRPVARPHVTAEGPAWAMIDGDAGLGMVVSAYAMRTAMAKARNAGMAYVGVRNSCHFGAAGYYAKMAAEAGMLGIAMANDTPTMSVPGARLAVLGSNPFSCAIPSGAEFPILLDMATSAVAGGKVFAAATRGESIPAGWIIDEKGRPTTNPKLFPDAASLVPMAAHKGYGIALLIETLSAILTGASIAGHVLSWSFAEASLPTNHGAAFLALDLNAMMPLASFLDRVKQTVREIRETPRAEGCDRIYLPGEMEWEKRQRALTQGLDLPEDVVANLRPLVDELSLDDSFRHAFAGKT